ncbi:protein ALP1-like [Acropora millepora]|uniref:protein ALP1-like n=1 Tax=Acropora millepora TaxID=45264 RepID=UPI001CF3DC23|nr:protein ALP1-like [Acropora millepora]
MIAPKTTNDWVGIANEFKEEWHFPNCIGAIDGKHVMMECPKNGGSAFYNYKGFHSIVLLAVCDAKYCFTLLDIGGVGSANDASILSESNIGRLFEKSPSPSSFLSHSSHGSKTLPYVIVGDDIFPSEPWLMKPFPGRNLEECHCVFNYRLSRARRCIENAFGILSAKWRIFYRPIKGNVDLVKVIVAATVCLHNYLVSLTMPTTFLLVLWIVKILGETLFPETGGMKLPLKVLV